MNLLLRLCLILLRKIFFPLRPAVHPLAPARLAFHCWPHDCDYNLHMTNSRYASFCDLARIGAMLDYGALLPLIKRGYTPIVTAQNSIHFREISLGSSFTVESSIVGWDERFWYYQHDFKQGDALKARVYAKGFFVRRKKVIPFHDVLSVSGHDLRSPPLPELVKNWGKISDQLFQDIAKGKES